MHVCYEAQMECMHAPLPYEDLREITIASRAVKCPPYPALSSFHTRFFISFLSSCRGDGMASPPPNGTSPQPPQETPPEQTQWFIVSWKLCEFFNFTKISPRMPSSSGAPPKLLTPLRPLWGSSQPTCKVSVLYIENCANALGQKDRQTDNSLYRYID